MCPKAQFKNSGHQQNMVLAAVFFYLAFCIRAFSRCFLPSLFAFFERHSNMLRPACPLLLKHDEKKNHLVSLHPFILLLQFLFFLLRVPCSELSFVTKPCLRVQLRLCSHQNFNQLTTPHLQPTLKHWLPKTSLRTTTGLPANQQTWETPLCNNDN